MTINQNLNGNRLNPKKPIENKMNVDGNLTKIDGNLMRTYNNLIKIDERLMKMID